MNQVERSLNYYQQALAIHREIGDGPGEALGHWKLGLLYEKTDPARAIALMSKRVAYEREIGHSKAEADARRVAQIQTRLEQPSPDQQKS